MPETLNTPFKSKLMGEVPNPKSHESGHYNSHLCPCVDKPATTGVIDFKFYEDGPGLSGSPAALASPMGTAIPGIGHGFKGGK